MDFDFSEFYSLSMANLYDCSIYYFVIYCVLAQTLINRLFVNQFPLLGPLFSRRFIIGNDDKMYFCSGVATLLHPTIYEFFP